MAVQRISPFTEFNVITRTLRDVQALPDEITVGGNLSVTSPQEDPPERSGRGATSASDNIYGLKTEIVSDSSILNYCISIAEFGSEAHRDMQSKLTDLLGLIDIKVLLENDRSLREKRALPFLARFVFKNGFRMVWGLLASWITCSSGLKSRELIKRL